MKIRKIIISLLAVCLLAGCGSGNGEEFASVDDTEEMNYTILSKDVPDFDTSPIRYGDHGYIYLENGSYGFITADNENIVPSGRYITTRILQGVCMYENESTASEPNVSIDQLLGLTDQNSCSCGIGGIPNIYVLGSDDQVYSVMAKQVETATPDGHSYLAPKSDPYASEFDWSNYYIVASDLKTVYGPYDASETASFSATQVYNLDSSNPYKGSLSIPDTLGNTNFGLFYEKTGKGYIIHSIDGLSSSEETYDYAQPISKNAMKVEKDGKMGVVDTSLNEVYMGDFQDCSELINNKGYVKVDGKWLYVEFDGLSSEEQAKADYTEGYITLSGKYTTAAKENHNYVLIQLDSPVNLTVEGKVYENVDTIELAEEVINDSVNEGDSIIVYGKLEANEISEVNYADYYLNHAFICTKENYIPGIYSLSKECSIYDKPNGTQADAKFSKGKKVIIIFIFLHKDGSAWGLTSDYTWICLKDKSGNSNAKCIQKMAADPAKSHTDYVPGTYSVKKEIQVYDGPSKTTRVRELKQGEEVIIIYVFIDEDGHIWGMIKDGEWIYMDSSVSLQGENMTSSADDTNKEEKEECPYAAGTYRLNYDMNVRTEPVYTDDNSNIRTVNPAGSDVTVSEIVKDSNGAYWGKIGDKQWICIWGSYNGGARDYMTRL